MMTKAKKPNDTDMWIEFLVPIKDEASGSLMYHPHVKYKIKGWDSDYWYITRKGYENGFPIKKVPDTYYIIGTVKKAE